MENCSAESPFTHPLMTAMHRVNSAMLRVNMPEWVHLDLSIGQLKSLMVLTSHPRISIGTMAEMLEVSKPTASILIDRLVQLGLVQRTEDADDRRRTVVEVTEPGGALVARLRQGGGERLAHWIEQMQREDLEALQRGLEALAGIAEREAAPTSASLPVMGA